MGRPRDPQHHTCVERQAYRGMAMLLFGWVLAVVLPFGVALVALMVASVAIPVLELAYDTELRRRARLTDEDRKAGRW